MSIDNKTIKFYNPKCMTLIKLLKPQSVNELLINDDMKEFSGWNGKKKSLHCRDFKGGELCFPQFEISRIETRSSCGGISFLFTITWQSSNH
ncbi:uncharacterized protein OCT59_029086 [Rhizophagus irregularis]|uniref:uncharacterized protein n=1 Tax=Rhizophagus irregularis TaxID=588596 RepID=UPI0019DFB1B5|nr:hypothetical protein OCT59_029086 [Rhizophagus irregularis]GBC34410.2 hypothetical protein RIR_jg37143.t1 [Rhizophagus irregularis DAOM 181602=DAOM 197198]CAG8694302.1 22918_t:CDS:2 [Rhizophagus irregularis]